MNSKRPERARNEESTGQKILDDTRCTTYRCPAPPISLALRHLNWSRHLTRPQVDLPVLWYRSVTVWSENGGNDETNCTEAERVSGPRVACYGICRKLEPSVRILAWQTPPHLTCVCMHQRSWCMPVSDCRRSCTWPHSVRV